MGIVQGRSYGRSVALTTGLMFAAVAGVLLGDWRELGPMAALLCAEESAGITGQVISVDGGYGV